MKGTAVFKGGCGGVTPQSSAIVGKTVPVGKMRVSVDKMRVCGKSYFVRREIARYRYVFVAVHFGYLMLFTVVRFYG